MDSGRPFVRTNPFAQAIGVVNGYVEYVAVGVLHQQIFTLHTTHRTGDQSHEFADAIFQMHHIITGSNVGEVSFGRGRTGVLPAARRGTAPAEYFGIAEQIQQDFIIFAAYKIKPFADCAVNKGESARVGQQGQAFDGVGLGGGVGQQQRRCGIPIFIAPKFGQAGRLQTDHNDAVVFDACLFELGQQGAHLTAVARPRLERVGQAAKGSFGGFRSFAQNERLPPGQVWLDDGPIKNGRGIIWGQHGLFGGDLVGVLV